MRTIYNFFVHSFLSARSNVLLPCLLFVFSSFNIYSQTLDSPPYGISVEKWEQIQNAPKSNPVANSYNSLGGVFNNGGFEVGDFSGWVTQDLTSPFFPLQVNSAGVQPWFGFFVSDPPEGSFAAMHGWDGDGPGAIRLAQDISLPSNAVSLEFDYRAAWDLLNFGATLDRNFIIRIEPTGGGSPLLTDTILTAEAGTNINDTGDLHASIDVSAYANSSIRISFDWIVPELFTGPAFFQLDNVYIKYTGPQIIVNEYLDFWHQEVGTSSSPRTVTIRSVGTSNCTVSGISDPGLPFILSNVPSLPVVIPPGESKTFEVTFSPAIAGVFNSTITVTSDDSVDPTQDVLLTGVGVVINPAMFGVCYASTGNIDGGRLLTIDLNTGAGTLIGPTGLDQVPGLAINSNGVIYGMSDDPDAGLYKIDAVTGAAVFVGNTGMGFMPAIAFDGNDVLYGLGLDFNTFVWNLYTIDTTTGLPTIVGPAPMGEWRGMAFDPTDGTIWASTNGQEIYVINPITGTPTLIGLTGLNGGVPDIHFDDAGNLYGAVGGGGSGNNDFISINKISGEGTIIGSIGFTSVSGMASRQQLLFGPQIGLIPGIANFPNTEVGTSSSPITITIRSVGTENLNVSGISDPGSPFILSNVPSLPVVIPPGGSETFDVKFSPTSPGTFNATVTVTSNDPDNSTKDVILKGTGLVINPAISGVPYASTGNADGGNLLTIDINTGAGTLVGPTGMNAVPGLAINSNGQIFATNDDANADLYKVDATTGAAVFVGNTGLTWMPAIAFDDNDVLYGVGTDFSTEFNLYTLDITTGVPTLVGLVPTIQFYELRGLAFNPTDGTLWASTNNQNIYVIDPNTGTPTLVGTTGLSGGVPDIFFDATGNLYGAVGGGGSGNNSLISINKTTGAGTIIGSIGFTSVSGLSLSGLPVSVNDGKNGVPNVYELSQNYPNPFNPSTLITFQIPNKGQVTLKVFDIIGNEIKTLVNEEKTSGDYEVEFDGTALSSGVYFYQLRAGSFVETKKMVLMK